MKNLKDNIWIEGFDGSEQVTYNAFRKMTETYDALIWHGETSDIPEEIAKECVQFCVCSQYGLTHLEFHDFNSGWNILKTAKESIQSACNQEYCIIFKK